MAILPDATTKSAMNIRVRGPWILRSSLCLTDALHEHRGSRHQLDIDTWATPFLSLGCGVRLTCPEVSCVAVPSSAHVSSISDSRLRPIMLSNNLRL